MKDSLHRAGFSGGYRDELPTDPDIQQPITVDIRLRDWFAGLAMQALAGQDIGPIALAQTAYAIADEMLKARERND